MKNPWVRAALLLSALGTAFVTGIALMFVVQNLDRIKTRFAKPTLERFADTEVANWSKIETGLLTMERADIQLGDTVGFTSGGAIDSIGNVLLYVSASGHIATVDLDDGKIEYSPVRVPMDFDRLQVEVFADRALFNTEWFRVQDILIKQESSAGEATLYVSHNVFETETNNVCAVISRTKLDTRGGAIKLVDGVWDEFYRIRECVSMDEFNWKYFGLESGGKMLLLDDNHILMGVGDYGIPWELFAHDRVGAEYDNDFSKVISIDLTTGEPEVYANGVRNPQGLTRDSDGRIWEAEHGPQGGDEINLLVKGADYGWPTVSLGVNYESRSMPIYSNPVQGRHVGFDQPAMAFMPSIGISAIAAIPDAPKAFGLWEGDLLAVSLRDQSLFHLRRDQDRIVYSERIELGVRLRDIIVLDNGSIAILTGGDRRVILLKEHQPESESLSAPIAISGYEDVNTIQETVLASVGEADPYRAVFRNKCANCHNVNGESGIGPALNGVIGRKIGSVEGFNYSGDLTSARGKWTKDKLIKFAENPQLMYSSTYMPEQEELKPWERRYLLKYLSGTE